MKTSKKMKIARQRLPLACAVLSVVLIGAGSSSINSPASAASSTFLSISQIPLTVSTPAHPQVLIAIGNSESMDGTLSGAIMTGSGSLSSDLSTLNSSSSPSSYAVPVGFTPPMQAADGSGNAPYTVSSSGNLVDNGASRLNVAKAGVQAIIQAYIQNTDFALESYNTFSTSLYSTWVYYMSPATTGFVFTNTKISGNRYVTNPCYGYMTASTTIKSNCTSIAGTGLYTASLVASSAYMQIGASSDDANINDVLYAFGQPGVYINYGGTNPATPFPPYYSLANYNSGSILISYNSSAPTANTVTGPTNAGYVPYSPHVMYAQRGFGYGGGQSSNTGNILVGMKTAGATPTTSSITTAVNSFLPLLAPETNNLSTSEIKSVAGQAPTAGILAQAKSYLGTVATASNGCAPKQYVILISDGLPTQDMAGLYWPPLGSAAALGYGVTATFNADGSLKTTNDQALTDTIANLTALNQAGIKTFIVGLGAGVDPTLNPQAAATLQAMAIAGGSGSYYPAVSAAALVTNLNSILLAVQSGSLSTTSAAVNSTHLQNGTVEYQSHFTSSDATYQDWTGDLVEQALDPLTGVATGTNLWSAQGLLDTKVTGSGWSSGRIISTWNPSLNSGAGGGVPFLWANISSAQQSLLQPSDSSGQNRLAYLRGNTALEQRNGGSFRNRTHILGDIVDSQPIYVGAPVQPYFSTSYRAFQLAQAARQPMLYVGANDGMLHAFNAATGVEQFSFIPNAVYSNLPNLTAPLYNQNHRFYINASPQVSDVQFTVGGAWHTLLVSAEGAGGKSVFALDITTPQNLTSEAAVATAALWEFTDTDMGYGFSEPQTAPINAAPGFAVFFGNGYNSANNNAVLYAVNPQNGQILKKFDLCAAVTLACNPLLPQGLSTVATSQSDGLQGQPITKIYAGDLQGNLWAINVSNSNPSNWTVRLMFQARDASNAILPITTAPVVTLHPKYPRYLGEFVMFGTGQLLTTSDLSNTQTQAVFGVWDKPLSTSTGHRSDLQSQTLGSVSASASGLPQDVLTVTSNLVDWTTKLGWYEDLSVPGQRVITAPQLVSGAFLTTLNTPPSNSCSAGFDASFLEINYQTGGGFDQPQLDINGDGLITAADTIAGKAVAGVRIGVGYASSPTIIGPNKKNQISKLITRSGGQQASIADPNNTPRRLTWWQIQ